MKILKINNRSKIIVALLALVVVFSIGGGLGYAFFFGGTSINLQKGLVGHWKMDGNAKDATPNSNHGTLAGPLGANNLPQLTTDRKCSSCSKAYSFDGTDDYISIGTKPSTTTGTLSAWAKQDVAAGALATIVYGGQGGDGYGGAAEIHLGVVNSQAEIFIEDTTVSADNCTLRAGTMTAGQWNHILATYTIAVDSISCELFLNGVSLGTDTGGGQDTSVWLNQIFIGAVQNLTTRFFNGSIDDVRIYNRALSSAEISALYESYNPSVVISDLQKGLVGHWDFGAGSTTSATPDRTPYNNDGTVTGATLTTDRKGQLNKAYSFDGTVNTYITVPATSNLNFTSQDFSISMWVYWNTKQDNDTWVNKGGFQATGWYIRTTSNNAFDIRFNQVGSTTGQNTNNGVIGVGAWYHIAITRTGATVLIYVNGVDQTGAHTDVIDPVNNPNNALLLGGNLGNGTLDGKMDDVRIYNRALSATEVTALYEEYDPGIVISDLQKGLVANWSLDGNAKDRTPYRNHGTVTGATLTTDRKGQLNKAYNFNGTSDYIQNANVTGLPSSRITVAAWVKIDTHRTWNMSVIHDHWAYQGGWVLLSSSAGTGYFSITTVASTTNVDGTVTGLQTGVWYHFVGVYDGSYVRLYVNGVEGTPGALSGFTLDSAGKVTIGAQHDGGSSWFPGSIDDVRVYNRALSATEVTALYESYR